MADRPTSRRLAEHALGLGEPADATEIERALAADPELQRWRDRIAELADEWTDDELDHPDDAAIRTFLAGHGSPDVRAHLLECEDCRMLAEVLRADAPPTSARRPPPWAAIAASILLVSTLTLVGRELTREPADDGYRFEPVELRTTRGDSATIDLGELDGAGIALEIEAHLPGGTWFWVLQDTRGVVALQGTLVFEGEASELREFELLVPRGVLTVRQYVLMLRSAETGEERLMRLEVTDRGA